MTGMAVPASGLLLIVDANVLIDYARSDRSILSMASRRLGQIFVASPVLEEVDQLDAAECEMLGLQVVEMTLQQLSAAAVAGLSGQLSFPDHCCLLLAREGAFTCVTNDGRLRRACTEAHVPVLWGLELMVGLVAKNELTVDAAISTAREIRLSNPRHITEEILEKFAVRLRAAARGKERQ